ncbi:MAG: tRNA (adenine-N1)-methyltransferase [Deltaproteobacteria bacterium]|nr:tRNA (adenine-N1)-methyltransferase [Deltaproteobacteria bacterium]MBI3389699.1 tRNA (adenine-N1)-methyltransferase [Deltaproteobacteria bacterium]
MTDSPRTARLVAGDSVLFIDHKEREYLRTLRAGGRVNLRSGSLQADQLIGQEEGTVVYNTAREPFLMLRPTFAQLIPNLPRKAQVIYPKDIGPILLWGDMYPGATVVEIGAGPGALTMALLRAVGPHGHVTSYEARADFVEMARHNVEQFHGPAANWTLKLADAAAGISERNVDRMVLDLAEPWQLLPQIKAALRPGGLVMGYVPTALQIKEWVDGLRAHGFGAVQVMETLQRFWHVKARSVRPEHRMVAHTGFITVARRLAAATAAALAEQPTNVSADDADTEAPDDADDPTVDIDS